MGLAARRDGDAVVVTVEEDGGVVTLVRKPVVLSTSEAAGSRTPFKDLEDLEPHEQELVGVVVQVRWCRPEPVVAGTDQRRRAAARRVQEMRRRGARVHPNFAPMRYSTCAARWGILRGAAPRLPDAAPGPTGRSPAAIWGMTGGARPDSPRAHEPRGDLLLAIRSGSAVRCSPGWRPRS